MFVDCSIAYAFNSDSDTTPDTSAYAKPGSTPFLDQDRSHRINLMVDYAKKQVPGLAPGLPAFIRNPNGWVSRTLGMSGSGEDSSDGITSFLQPVQSMFQQPSVNAPEAMWISPSFHHKGFLPVNDAMVMGMHLRHSLTDSLLGNQLQYDVHPFYGQNWRSTDNYWGTEVAFNLRSDASQESWGKIAVRFTNGDTDLMDHGHGFDMHTQLNFDQHLSLHAGIREDGNSSAGDYVMLRWKLVDGF